MKKRTLGLMYVLSAAFLLLGGRAYASELPEQETVEEEELSVAEEEEAPAVEEESEELAEAEAEDLKIYQLGYLGEAPVADETAVFSDDVEMQVQNAIYNSLINIETGVDLKDYQISYTFFQECCEKVVNAHPEIFYLTSYRYVYWPSTGMMYRAEWIYMTDESGNTLSKSQINSMKSALQQKQSNALAMLEDGMTDLQIALALHDYLALSIEYTYPTGNGRNDPVYSAYGALVNGQAVCQGYALAYDYLLSAAGIPNMFVASSDLNHGWNLVYVGGNWYHVDITWDDSIGFAACTHRNFLLSDSEIKWTGHSVWDTVTPETSDKYDDGFWQNIYNGLFYDAGYWYYFNNGTQYTIDSAQHITTTGDTTWENGSTWAWGSGTLYANNRSEIMAVDFSDRDKQVAANMKGLGYSDGDVLQGIEIRGNRLYCDVNGNISEYKLSDLQAGTLYQTDNSGNSGSGGSDSGNTGNGGSDSGNGGNTGSGGSNSGNTGSGSGNGSSGNTSTDAKTDDYIKNDKVKQFVARFYRIIMERDYDREGLDYWTDGLKAQRYTGAQLAEQFVMSQEFLNKNVSNAEFINIMYRTCMGREADAEGRNYWLSVVNKGVSYRYILKGFVQSTEFGLISADYGITVGNITLTENRDRNAELSAFVARCYEKVMLRTSDADGMNYWTGILHTKKMTPEQVAEKFVTAPEFVQRNYNNTEFIKILYQTFMGRAYDQGGLEYWIGQMNAGRSRTDILHSFATSKEFQMIIRSFGL